MIARLITRNAPRHSYLTRASICQPTPRASLTSPVSSSCCTGLRHHAACHHALRIGPQGIPYRANDPPRPHHRTATRRAPQRTIALQAALTNTTPHPRDTAAAPPLSAQRCALSQRPSADPTRAREPASKSRKPTRPAARHCPADRAHQRHIHHHHHTRHSTSQTPATHATRTTHTESSPAYFRGMHRCTSGRSCVQLRADDPLDSCVGCIVLVQRVCVLCVLYVWMSSVMLSIHLFTDICLS